jgi:hypothetical protein
LSLADRLSLVADYNLPKGNRTDFATEAAGKFGALLA